MSHSMPITREDFDHPEHFWERLQRRFRQVRQKEKLMDDAKSNFDDIFGEILMEVILAEAKWPVWPSDVIHGAALVAEEAGELVKAANEFVHEQKVFDAMRREALHTAATAIRMMRSLSQYNVKYKPEETPDAR